jgi:GNAT superfamily N-acetyltransferase
MAERTIDPAPALTSDRVRPFEPADLPRLERLYAEAWPGDGARKMRGFRWIDGENPFRDAENGYLVCERGDELIGYWGRMPIRLHAGAAVIPAAFSQETLVAPSARRQGVASRLGRGVYATALPLLSVWHNEKMHAIMMRAGWTEVGRYRVLKKVYRLDGLARRAADRPFLSRVLRLGDPLVRTLMRAPDPKPGQLDVQEIDRFDSEFDNLFVASVASLGIMAERTSAVLNWKYVDIPHRAFRRLGARSMDGRLVGYAIVDVEDVPPFRRGTVVDMLADPTVPGVADALATAADRIFAEQEVDLAVALALDPRWIRAFRKRRFYRARATDTSSLLIWNPSGPLDGAMNDIDQWYLTFGDSDGHMW